MLSADSAHVRKRLITSLYKNSAEGGVAPIGGDKAVGTPLIHIKYRSSSLDQGVC